MSSQIVHADLCITDRSRRAARTSAASPGVIFRFPPLVLRCSSGREGQLVYSRRATDSAELHGKAWQGIGSWGGGANSSPSETRHSVVRQQIFFMHVSEIFSDPRAGGAFGLDRPRRVAW